MNGPLRFGIVGCGVIGHAHAEAIARLPEAELVAVCDEAGTRAAEMAAHFGVESCTRLEDLLSRTDVDAVTICTPSGLHGEPACAAMRSGRHIVVEKPMEVTLERIDTMLRVQRESGVQLTVISQRRFDPAPRRVHGLIEEGALGQLVLASAQVPWWRSQEYYESGGWRGTWALDGGGVLMNQGIHTVDLLLWLMGPVHSVFARTGTLAHRMETEDTAAVTLRFASGALGTIAATTSAYPGMAARLEVMGDRGSAAIEDDRLTYLRLARDDEVEVGPYGVDSGGSLHETDREDPGANPGSGGEGGHEAQIADFIRAIRTGTRPLVDGEAARAAVQLILAVYQSARLGQEITIDR